MKRRLAVLAIFICGGAFARPPAETFIPRALEAIEKLDVETIEGLRDEVKPQHIPQLVAKWNKNLPWPKKDAFVFLLCDQLDPLVHPMMRDALDSPDVESRATGVCILQSDFKLCTTFRDKKGFVVPARVDAAVAEYKKKHP